MRNAHAHDHSHDKGCNCDHGHDHHQLSLAKRWLISVLIISTLLVILRPFVVDQMLVRVTSYSANASYSDAVRICKKIIAIDPDNRRAWTSLGYVYMDDAKVNEAITAFERVLQMYPDDHGAASYELGQAYYAQRDYLKAIARFERVRGAGPKAGMMLEADILKYRHGTLGFRSLNSMQTLLGLLHDGYLKTGDAAKAVLVQKEYDVYKNKHSRLLF